MKPTDWIGIFAIAAVMGVTVFKYEVKNALMQQKNDQLERQLREEQIKGDAFKEGVFSAK